MNPKDAKAKTPAKTGAAAHVVHQADGRAIITLSKPYSIAGAQAAQLVMREPTVNDQLAADAGAENDQDRELNLISNLCMVSIAELQALTLRDYKRVQVAFLGFTD